MATRSSSWLEKPGIVALPRRPRALLRLIWSGRGKCVGRRQQVVVVCGEHRVQGGTSQQMARALPYLGAMILPLLIMKLGRGRVGMSRVVARKRCVRKQGWRSAWSLLACTPPARQTHSTATTAYTRTRDPAMKIPHTWMNVRDIVSPPRGYRNPCHRHPLTLCFSSL